MHLSDVDFLRAAQSGDDHAKKELATRFGPLLLYLTHHACRLNGLPLPEADDIIQLALLKVLSTATPFDPARSDGVESYLRGLVQTAARTHRRFLQRGPGPRHDWGDPDNSRRGLPLSEDAICDTFDPQGGVETREIAAAVLASATAEERGLVYAIYYKGNTIKDVAAVVGVDPSTMSRKLTRFYRRTLARGRTLYGTNWRNPG